MSDKNVIKVYDPAAGDMKTGTANTKKEVLDKIDILNGTGTTKEKANKVDLESHKAEIATSTNGVHGLKIEEGSWTPTIFGVTVEGSPIYASRVGSYYKVGKQVFIRGAIQLTSKGGLQGQVRMGGLPFAPTIDKFTLDISYITNMNLAREVILGQIRLGGVINLSQHDKTSVGTTNDSHIADNFIIEFSGHYTAA